MSLMKCIKVKTLLAISLKLILDRQIELTNVKTSQMKQTLFADQSRELLLTHAKLQQVESQALSGRP